MTTARFDAIVFDMDGTLISSEGIYEEAWQTLLARRGQMLTHEIYERHFAGVANRACAEGYLGLRGDAVEQAIAEMEALYWEYAARDGIAKIPGVIELLDRLAGVPMAIATNTGSTIARRTLELADLAHRFPVLVTVDQVPEGKPSPDVYLEAAHRLGVPPARCIAVEDSRPGMAAAQASGMFTVGITTSHMEFAGADLVIDAYDDPRFLAVLPNRR